MRISELIHEITLVQSAKAKHHKGCYNYCNCFSMFPQINSLESELAHELKLKADETIPEEEEE